MKIAIIGFGHVGKHVEQLIKDHYEYCVYDPNIKLPVAIEKESTSGTLDILPVFDGYPPLATKEYINKNCKLAIICVPTPMAEDGSCDTSIVEESVKWLQTPLILIKSTVEPGTVDRLKKKFEKRICFSPEFVGESTYYNPIMTSMMEEPFMIFGGETKDTQVMVDIFQPIKGPLCKYVQCKAIEAELCKYMENSFYATKVAFFNEFFDICEKVGVEYDIVRELFLNDPRINRNHTSVFKGKRGYSGKCYPKDILALTRFATKNGYEAKIMKQVINSNQEFIKKNKKYE